MMIESSNAYINMQVLGLFMQSSEEESDTPIPVRNSNDVIDLSTVALIGRLELPNDMFCDIVICWNADFHRVSVDVLHVIPGSMRMTDQIYREIDAVQQNIPTATSDLTNDSSFITLAEVPPISAADKAEIISEVEASIEPPTMDAATEQRIIEQVTADLNIPDSTSDLTNDSGFITQNDIPSIPDSTSDLINDSGFITQNDIPAIPTKTSDLTNDSGFITADTNQTLQVARTTPTRSTTLGTTDSVGFGENGTYIYGYGVRFSATNSNDTTNALGLKGYSLTTSSRKLMLTSNDGSAVKLGNVATPVDNNDAANKAYVDTQISAISVPDSTSDLTNDSGFITSADVPTTVAELSDATSYATKTYVDDAIAAIPSGGGSGSGNIPTYNRQDSNVGGYLLYSGTSADNAADSLYKSRDLSVGNNSSSTTLYVGNATDGSQSQRGIIALQGNTTNSQNYYNSLVSAGLTANVTNTLPSGSGTLLNTSNISVTQAQDSGVEIGTIAIDQTSTKLYAPAALSNYTNDVGYVTASEVPSVGIMAIPVSYNETSETYETTFTTADIQRLDFPIISFENKYFYLDDINTTNGAMVFYNLRALMKRAQGSNNPFIYGFVLTAGEDATTGEQTESIEPLVYTPSGITT